MQVLRRASTEMPVLAFLCACTEEELRWIEKRSTRSESREGASRCLSCRRGEAPCCEYGRHSPSPARADETCLLVGVS